jgi:hypothetical protein
MNIRPAATLLILAFLSACGDGSNDASSGGVSAEDAETLDAAAAKLDAEAAGVPEREAGP